MKAILAIDQQSRSGFLSGKTHSYILKAAFRLNEKEKKIFNEHPLFQTMIFMRYLSGKKKDIPMDISAKDLYDERLISIDAYSVNDIIDYHNEIISAGNNFISYLNILTDVIAAKELSFGESN